MKEPLSTEKLKEAIQMLQAALDYHGFLTKPSLSDITERDYKRQILWLTYRAGQIITETELPRN